MSLEVSLLRSLGGILLLIVAGALASGDCARGETEADMRRRVRSEERSRQRELTRERERSRQVERRRLERLRRDLAAKQRKLEGDRARSGAGGEAGGEAKQEGPRLVNQAEAMKRKVSAMGASTMGAATMGLSRMAAPRRAYRRRSPAPASRRRLKRPRRRRSPSLEGLFE